MSDGLLAIAFALGALGRIGFGDGLSGDPTPRLGLQVGREVFQGEAVGTEAMVTRDLGWARRGLRAVAAASVGEGRAVWAGSGLAWTLGTDRVWMESSLLPGLYAGEPDLGSAVEFRSSLGLTYAFDSGATITLSVDHRSNGDLASENPGLETVGLRWSWPLR